MAYKFGMNLSEVNMQVSKAHRNPKSAHDNQCRPTFVQFVNWHYAVDIHKKLIGLHANNKSKVTLLQMFSKSLTDRRSSSAQKKRNIEGIARSINIFRFSGKTNG